MNEELVELKLQFLKGHVEIRDSEDSDFPDGKYMSFSRLVKKVGDKLYLEIVLSNKNPNIRCHKCKRRIPPFYPFGYTYKQINCSEGESTIICLDCLGNSKDEDLAYFIMAYGQMDPPITCKNCFDKNDPDTCLIKQKWDKIGEEIGKEFEAYFDQREKKRSG